MRAMVTTLLVCILVCGAARGGEPLPAYNAALKDLGAGRQSRAIGALKDLVDAAPGFIRPYGKLVDIHHWAGELASVESFFATRVTANAKDKGALFAMGRIAELRGRWRQALDYYRRSVALRPQSILPYEHLAAVFQRMRETAPAFSSKIEEFLPERDGSAYLEAGWALHFYRLSQWDQAALAFAAALRRADLLEIRDRYAHLLRRAGRFEECRRVAAEGISKAAPDPELLVWLHIRAGWGAGRLTEYELVLEHTALALPLAQQLGDLTAEVEVLNLRAATELRLGSLQQALRSFDRALALLDRTKDERTLARIHNNIAIAYQELGEFARAQRSFEVSLAINEKLGVRRNVVANLLNIGSALTELGNYADAISVYRKGYAEALVVGSLYDQVWSLTNQATLLRKMDRLDEARVAVREAMELTTRSELGLGRHLALRSSAELLTEEGRLAEARRYHQEALILAERVKYVQGIIEAQVDLARLARKENRTDEEIVWLRRAVDTLEGAVTEGAVKGREADSLKSWMQVYSDLFSRLMDSGRSSEAFVFAKQTRAGPMAGLLGPEFGRLGRPTQASRASRWHTYGTSDGLLSDVVHSLRRAEGELLIGTGSGLCSYDGRGFACFLESETHGSLHAVASAQHGGVWMGTADGLLRKGDGEWKRWTTDDGLASNTVSALLETAAGVLWIGSAKGLHRLQDGALSHYGVEQGLPDPYVTDLLLARDGTLWVGTLGGVCRLRHGRFDSFAAHRGQTNEAVLALAQDGTSTVWIATPGGLRRYNGDQLLPFDDADLPADWFTALVVDSAGKLFAGTLAGGVGWLEEGVWHALEPLPGGSNASVHAVEFAPDGSLWVASAQGLHRFDRETWLNLDSRPGQPPWRAVLHLEPAPDGTLWIVNQQSGLVHFDGDSFVEIRQEKGRLPADSVSTVHATAKGIWVGTASRGLAFFDGKTWEPFDFASLQVPIQDIASAAGQALWVGTLRNGAFKFDGERWRQFVQQDGLPSNDVHSIAVQPADGRHDASDTPRPVWFGTGNGVIRYLDGDFGEPLLANHVAHALVFADERTLWLATNRGVVRATWELGRGEGAPPSLTRFDESVGVPNEVRDLLVSSDGKVIWATPRGIYLHDGTEQRQVTVADGLRHNSVHSLAEFGEYLWIGTEAGPAALRKTQRFTPETLVSSDAAHWQVVAPDSRTYAEHAWTGSRRADPKRLRGGRSYFNSEAAGTKVWRRRDIELSPDGYVPWSPTTVDQLRFQVKVDSGEWSAPQAAGEFVVTDLDDAEHAIYVRARDRMLAVDPTPAVLRLNVQVPLPGWLYFASAFSIALALMMVRKRVWVLMLKVRFARFRPIEPSPFVPQRPAEGERFVGRRKELTSLEEMTRTGGMVAVLWGERGAGKFSLQRELARRIDDNRTLVIEMDLAVAAAGGDLGELVRSLSQGLVASLEAQGIDRDLLSAGRASPPSPSSSSGSSSAVRVSSGTVDVPLSLWLSSRSMSDDSNPFALLDEGLARLEKARPDIRVVFALANGEVLAMALDSDAAYGSYLFPFLRSLVQQRTGVSVVLTMEGRWQDLSKRFEQLFAFATPMSVGRLGWAESSQLLREALSGKALLPPKPLDRLVDFSGGHAYLLQLLGQHLVAEMNSRRTNVATVALVDKAAEGLVDDPDARLGAAWMQLSREEKLVVAALCASGRRGRIGAVPDVVEWLSESGAKLLPEEVRRAILSLEHAGVASANEARFAMRGELFVRWVQGRHTIASVLEESYEYVGHYLLLETLGAGGMGVVYRARDMVHGAIVALKLLRPELSESKRNRRRFLREARLGKRLKHPNIVRIRDYGEQADRLYLAMEYLQGETLTHWVRKHPPPGARLVAEVGIHLASALATIHKYGVVHRDIKGDNIMVLRDTGASSAGPAPRIFEAAAVRLMDFGLAVGEGVSRMTRAGSVFGTASYMAPEQARGKEADARSDIYSLGAVLYELCTGRPPFEGSEVAAVLHAVIHDPLTPIHQRAPELPEALTQIIENLLSKDPSDRPQSATEAEERFRALLAQLPEQGQEPLSSADWQVSDTRAAERSVEMSAASGILSRSIEVLGHEGTLVSLVSSPSRDSRLSIGDRGRDMGRLLLLYRVSAGVSQGSSATEMLPEAMTKSIEVLGGDDGLAAWTDEKGMRVLTAAGHTATEPAFGTTLTGLLERSVREKTGLLYHPDNQSSPAGTQVGSAVCAPVWAGEQVFGSMVVFRMGEGGQEFDGDDLDLLASVGHIIGVGVERERLYGRLVVQNKELQAARHRAERRRAELDLLYQLERETSKSTDLDELLDSIIQRTSTRMRSNAGSVLLLDPDNSGRLYFRSLGQDSQTTVKKMIIEAGKGVVGWVAESGEPVIVNKPAEDPRHDPDLDRKLDHQADAILAVPLISAQKVIGALEVINPRARPRGASAYDLEDLKVMTVIAGQVARAVALIVDRESRLQTERLAAMGRMLAGVTHDLRNPMTVISGYAQLMATESDDQERQHRCDHILNQIEEMTSMISDLLAFSRGDSQIRPTTVLISVLAEDVQESLNVYAEPRGITLVVDADDKKARVDMGRAKRIIYNLAKNSLDVLGRGDRIAVTLREQAGGLHMTVVDTGPGIPEDVRMHMFEPFVSSNKEGGTGLGLSIVKRFVEDHNGTIAVDSREGEGTEFRVHLPRS